MPHDFRLILPTIGLTLALAAPAPAQEAGGDLQQSAYQQTLAQETIRKQSDKIQVQLAALIDALKLNGLDPAQLSALTNASSHLSNLNQDEMQKIINALQSASIASDDPKRRDSLVTAYQGQKELVLKLKQLSAQMAAQQVGDGLVEQLENLIARQTGNIRHTTDLVAAGKSTSDDVQNSQKIVASEQAGIGGEIDLLLSSLPSAVPTAAPAPNPAAPATDTGSIAKAVLDAANGTTLKADAAAASQLTASNTFGGAVGKEGAVRDGLVTLLHAALAHKDAMARLEQAKTQLDQVVADQKSVADATKEGKLDAAALADRQAQINDRAEVAKALLKPLEPAAADQVKTAQDAIKQSADALSKKPEDAVAKQDEAAKALAAAQDLLAKQMASVAAQDSQSPVDKLKQIEKAQAEIKQAQAQAQIDPKSAAQTAMAAQKDALAASTDAADKAGKAADDLQKPQPDVAAANQALTQANDALQKQKDDLAQAAQSFQALAAASQQLAQAQQNAASADQAMQGAANMTQAAHDLTQAQSDAQQAQAQAQQSGAPADAQAALQQAADALKGAANQAVQAKSDDAKAQNGKAQDAMKKAQDSLGKAMAAASKGAPGSKGSPGAPGAPQPGSPGGPPGSEQGPGGGGMATGAVQDEGPNGFEIGGGGGGTLKGVGAANGVANVVGALTPKDRDAISQYQGEKTAPEYAPLVQQYLKNLADSTDTQ